MRHRANIGMLDKVRVHSESVSELPREPRTRPVDLEGDYLQPLDGCIVPRRRFFSRVRHGRMCVLASGLRGRSAGEASA